MLHGLAQDQLKRLLHLQVGLIHAVPKVKFPQRARGNKGDAWSSAFNSLGS